MFHWATVTSGGSHWPMDASSALQNLPETTAVAHLVARQYNCGYRCSSRSRGKRKYSLPDTKQPRSATNTFYKKRAQLHPVRENSTRSRKGKLGYTRYDKLTDWDQLVTFVNFLFVLRIIVLALFVLGFLPSLIVLKADLEGPSSLRDLLLDRSKFPIRNTNNARTINS